ncbi:hypothetical protein [Cryobacterium fucosi]|nr:hypothetical protein [Cryobacterium fucosi]
MGSRHSRKTIIDTTLRPARAGWLWAGWLWAGWLWAGWLWAGWLWAG